MLYYTLRYLSGIREDGVGLYELLGEVVVQALQQVGSHP